MAAETGFRFDPPESEFTSLGVTHLDIETAAGNTVIPLSEFTASLPNANRFAQSYGIHTVASLLAKQLSYRRFGTYIQQSGLSKLASYLSALNHCISTEGEYARPLPYSVGLVLAAQLSFGVRQKNPLPDYMQARTKVIEAGIRADIPATDIPVSHTPFLNRGERQIFRDLEISEQKRREILKSGLVTLVGANLLYEPVSPYDTNFVLRNRSVRITDSHAAPRLTIPGGHTMSAEILAENLQPLTGQLNTGTDNLGHTLLDVTGLRETIEETHFPVFGLTSARPLTVADQIMRNSRGQEMRYLGFVWQTRIWQDAIANLEDGDSMGEWLQYGPFNRSDLQKLNFSPIAAIALKNFRD